MNRIRASRVVAVISGVVGLSLCATLLVAAARHKPAPDRLPAVAVHSPVTFHLENDLECVNPDGSIRLRRPRSETFAIRGNTTSKWAIRQGGHILEGETQLSTLQAQNGETIVLLYDKKGGQPIAVPVQPCAL